MKKTALTYRRLLGLCNTLALGLVASSAYAADDGSAAGIPGWVWGILAVVVLGVIYFFSQKDAKKTADKKREINTFTPTPEAKKPATPVQPKAAPQTPVVAATPTTPVTPSPAPTSISKLPPEPVAAPVPVDPLQEAKQLLALQRYPQAVGVLNKGLQKEPERSDLMLELLGIYFKQNDHDAFDELFEQIVKLDDPIALLQAEELRNEFEYPPAPPEDSDLIEYDAKKATLTPIHEEAPAAAPIHDADALAFSYDAPVPATEAKPAEPATPEVSTDHLETLNQEFKLETVEEKPFAHEDVEHHFADLDFKDVDFKDTQVEPEPLSTTLPDTLDVPEVAKIEAEKAPAVTEPQVDISHDFNKNLDQNLEQKDGLVDLEFDLDDSFALDDEHLTATPTAKSDWSADLADENFTSVDQVTPAKAVEAAPSAAPIAPAPATDHLLSSLDAEFPFLQTIDTHQTKLDLARNYIALGEINSARELLSEVVAQGAAGQQTEAKELIAKLAS